MLRALLTPARHWWRRWRVLSAYAAAALLSAVTPGDAYDFPPDPLQPTSRAQCEDLYRQYDAISEHLAARAKAAGDLAWQIVTHLHGGPYDPQARSLYRRSQILFDQAFDVRSEGSAARVRCNQRVHAYEVDRASEQRKQAADQRAHDRVAVNYMGHAAGEVTATSAANGLKTLQMLDNVPTGLKSIAATMGNAYQVGRMTYDLSGRGGIAGYVRQMVNSVARAGGWNPLQTFLTRVSINEVLNINSAASADLLTAMSRFDAGGPSLSEMLSGARLAENAVFNGSGASGELLPIQDHYSSELLEAYREHRGMYEGRGKAYDALVAKVNQQYKRAMSRPSSGSNGRSRKYSPLQCRQLLAQIREYRRVLPAYAAAGQGAMIQMGINANQRAYNTGCR